MSDILKAIKADFASKKMRHVKVPEWCGAKIYYDPLTAAERVNINKGLSENDDTHLMINMLLFKAKNEDGTLMFEDNADTRATFEGSSDFTVVARVAAQFGAAPKEQGVVDDAKKDLGATT